MPATSEAQRRAMAIAEHHPSELYGRNRGLLKMSHSQLHDFAATKETNLPHYVQTKQAKKERAKEGEPMARTESLTSRLRREPGIRKPERYAAAMGTRRHGKETLTRAKARVSGANRARSRNFYGE